MKMNIAFILSQLLLYFLLTTINMVTANEILKGKGTEIDLHPQSGIVVDYPIRVYIKYESQQLEDPKGINLALLFENNGSESIELIAGNKFCSVEILNEDGWPVAPKLEQIPAMFINSQLSRKANSTGIVLAPRKSTVTQFNFYEIVSNPKGVFIDKESEKLVELVPSVYKFKLHCFVKVAVKDVGKTKSWPLETDYFKIAYGLANSVKTQ